MRTITIIFLLFQLSRLRNLQTNNIRIQASLLDQQQNRLIKQNVTLADSDTEVKNSRQNKNQQIKNQSISTPPTNLTNLSQNNSNLQHLNSSQKSNKKQVESPKVNKKKEPVFKVINVQPSFLSKLRDSDRGLDLELVPTEFKGNSKLNKIFKKDQIQNLNPSILLLNKIKRTINGSNNNLVHPSFGQSNSKQKRHCTPVFSQEQKEKFLPVKNRPNPREISNIVGKARDQINLDKNNVTMAFTIWGQFIDHDIQFTPGSQDQFLPIDIPKCDDFFDSDCNGTRAFPFSRAKISDQQPQMRLPFNGITSWIDASMVYGSSDQQAKKLRKFEDGKLKTDRFKQNLLPEGPNVKNSTQGTMQGGDVRSNQNLILLSYQILFLREHNRLCDLIKNKFRNLTDQDIYNIARNYVGGLIQKITYQDYLPILFGKQKYKQLIGSYHGYDNTIDPSLQIEFTSTAYRFGHSLITPTVPLVNFMGDKFQFLNLDQMLFKADLMNGSTFQRIIRGASRTITKQRDGQFVEQLRNFLVVGAQFRGLKMDLLAINIHRGRDLGIPDYNTLRDCYGLPRKTDFNQISAQQQKNQQIKEVYKQIDKVDSYIGIQTQKSLAEDAILGQTSAVIVALAFRNLRDGDRFWYQRVYPPDIIQEIKSTKLSQIFLRNSLIRQLQQDLFHYHFGID